MRLIAADFGDGSAGSWYIRLVTSAPIQPGHRFTLEEYLRFEESTELKHEFHNGEILAMSGASPEHALITVNAMSAIHAQLRGKPCRIYSSDLKIGIMPMSRVLYPDGSIVCGALEFHPDDRKGRVVINPRIIVEVLSPTTEAYDRGEKFRHYRGIKSFEEYVMISQTSALIETFYRQPDGTWAIGAASTGLDAKAMIRTVQIELNLSDIYDGVSFPPPEPPPDPRERNFP